LDNLTIGNKIVLHLYDSRRHCHDRVFPIEMTQLGISRVIGIRRNHAGIELNRLVQGGLVEVRDAWVKGEKGQRKVYTLTPAGRELAEILAETSGIDLKAKPMDLRAQRENWLIETEMHMIEDRQRGQVEPETLALNQHKRYPRTSST
jgi:DNA-binding MarR family transcriptional regulator